MNTTRRRLIWTTAVAAVALVAAACQPTPYDFTGDHVADYGWMGIDGSYYLVGDPDPIFTPSTVVPADDPWAVPGDWDGDTKTEPAVVSRQGGIWETPDGSFTYAPADLDPAYDPADVWIPVPANWDKTDKAWEPAWYREFDATWFIQGQAPVQFGVGSNGFSQSGGGSTTQADIDGWAWDIPVPYDFNSNGEADIAVYRPFDGTYRTLDAGVIATVGLGFPAPADLYGDRAVEPAVYDPNAGEWRIGGAPSVSQPAPWLNIPPGNGIPLPVPADYDGDKKADFVLWDYDTGDFLPLGLPTMSAATPTAVVPSGMDARPYIALIRMTYMLTNCGDPEPVCPSGLTPP